MIKLLKSGNWALGGTQVVELVEGDERNLGPAAEYELVAAGWATWFEPKKDEHEAQPHPVGEGKLPKRLPAK